MKDLVDVEDIVGILEYLDDDRMNPQYSNESIADGAKSCVYTDEYENHCIAGEILHRFGFRLPHVESMSNYLPICELIYEMGYDSHFTEEAIEVLDVGQTSADNATNQRDPYSWGVAKVAMMNRARHFNGS